MFALLCSPKMNELLLISPTIKALWFNNYWIINRIVTRTRKKKKNGTKHIFSRFYSPEYQQNALKIKPYDTRITQLCDHEITHYTPIAI